MMTAAAEGKHCMQQQQNTHIQKQKQKQKKKKNSFLQRNSHVSKSEYNRV